MTNLEDVLKESEDLGNEINGMDEAFENDESVD